MVGGPSNRDDERHEAVCLKCGRCCYHKLLFGGDVLYTDVPCPYLDIKTRLCTVYEERSIKNPDCLGVSEGITRRVFPADCPYVANLPGYRPPITNPDPELIAELLDSLSDESEDAAADEDFGP